MDWPKCEKCEGTGKLRVWSYDKKEWVVITGGPCPECNGTGERDLTEGEAAELIAEYYQCCQIVLEEKIGGIWCIGVFIMKELKLTAQGSSLKEAFNAAARAVRSKG